MESKQDYVQILPIAMAYFVVGCLGFFYLMKKIIDDSNIKTIRKIEEAYIAIEETTMREITGLGLTVHLIQNQLPSNIVHVLLTPSQASNAKNISLCMFLEELNLKFQVVSNTLLRPTKNKFPKFKFDWHWETQQESSVYEPFIDAISETLLKLNLEIHNVSGGQFLNNQLLYRTSIYNVRSLDDNGRKMSPVYYKGEIRGRTDLVVVDNDGPWTYILRNNVRFAIEVKLPLQ